MTMRVPSICSLTEFHILLLSIGYVDTPTGSIHSVNCMEYIGRYSALAVQLWTSVLHSMKTKRSCMSKVELMNIIFHDNLIYVQYHDGLPESVQISSLSPIIL